MTAILFLLFMGFPTRPVWTFVPRAPTTVPIAPGP